MLRRSAQLLQSQEQWMACFTQQKRWNGGARPRSVQEAPTEQLGVKRSEDAPLDPYELRHRNINRRSPEQVEADAQRAVAEAGARASEALGGRADMLNVDPAYHMNEGGHTPKSTPFGDWASNVVGDGVTETVKQGTERVKDTLKKMFDPAKGGHGSSPTQAMPKQDGSGH